MSCKPSLRRSDTADRLRRQERALQTHCVELWAPQGGRFQKLLVMADSREEQIVLARDKATLERARPVPCACPADEARRGPHRQPEPAFTRLGRRKAHERALACCLKDGLRVGHVQGAGWGLQGCRARCWGPQSLKAPEWELALERVQAGGMRAGSRW